MITLHFLNDVANDAELAQISNNYVLIASLKSYGLALRTHVESLGKPREVNKRSQSLIW